jgi:nucleoside-diphosphate-sugar epimerase
MKVLLTGANGFVGSHVLEGLLAKGIATVVLLRPNSDRRFIEALLPRVEVRLGSITEPATLPPALHGVTHLVHCAGLTKALRNTDFHRVNEQGTRNLVAAAHAPPASLQRFVHVSSLAASRPATADAPAREDEPSQPVTEYGRSKLAAERAVREGCRAPFVILRPAAVYGPRDRDFLMLFKAVRAGFAPRFGGGRQELSLVFVQDLARAVVLVLTHPAAEGKVFNVASPEILTTRGVTDTAAALLGRKPFSPPLPAAWLWPACALAELVSRLTGRPRILSRQKYPELRAPGWVCDVSRLRRELGFTCETPLREGLRRTIAWYQENGWLA